MAFEFRELEAIVYALYFHRVFYRKSGDVGAIGDCHLDHISQVVFPLRIVSLQLTNPSPHLARGSGEDSTVGFFDKLLLCTGVLLFDDSYWMPVGIADDAAKPCGVGADQGQYRQRTMVSSGNQFGEGICPNEWHVTV